MELSLESKKTQYKSKEEKMDQCLNTRRMLYNNKELKQ